MVIGTGAQERGSAAQGAVLGGHAAQFPLDLQFREGRWQVQDGIAELGWDIGKELVDGVDTNGGQHLCLFAGGVGDVVGLEVVPVGLWGIGPGDGHYSPAVNAS